MCETFFRTKVWYEFVPFSHVKCLSFFSFFMCYSCIFFASEETKSFESCVIAWDLACTSLQNLYIPQNLWPWLFVLTIWWQHIKWKYFKHKFAFNKYFWWTGSEIYLMFNIFSVIRNDFGHQLICSWVNLFVRVS